MKYFGYVVGVIWIGLVIGSIRVSRAGAAAGHDDVALWWGIIGALLAIACLGAFVGTTIHNRSGSRSH